MATPKHAIVRAVTALAPDTRRIDFQMLDPETLEPSDQALGFVGGQYVIVDSQRTLPNGKAAKRAYSIVTPDRQQNTFSLVAKRVGEGLCSNYLHELAVGDKMRMSGPWGKFKSSESMPGKKLILATDTGITATLGFVHGDTQASERALIRILWLRVDGEVMSTEQIKPLLPEGLGGFEVFPVPAVAHPERQDLAWSRFDQALASFGPDHVLLAGDGHVILGYAEKLQEQGYHVPPERVESFFNMPKKSKS